MFAWTLFRRILSFCMLLAFLSGCVQFKPTPSYARAGDHIVLGLGGIERNSGGSTTIKRSDLTITLTDASSAQFDLEPRFIFKSYDCSFFSYWFSRCCRWSKSSIFNIFIDNSKYSKYQNNYMLNFC